MLNYSDTSPEVIVADVAARLGLVVGNPAQEAVIDPNLLAVIDNAFGYDSSPYHHGRGALVNAWRHRVDLLPESRRRSTVRPARTRGPPQGAPGHRAGSPA